MREALAIVGMACRYPDARTPAELWENVLAQRRAFRRMPEERLRLADYWRADRSDPDGIYSREAAVLEGWEFDRARFRVVGSTYRSADPAHWLALEVAAEALVDAGFPDGLGLPHRATGVLLGNSLTGEFSRANLMRLRWPYVRRVVEAALVEEGWEAAQRAGFLGRLEGSYKQPFPEMTEESLAGGLSNTIAGRICNHFDLKGGGYTVDGACASSLLAICQAATALAAGDLDVALAGGVDLSLDPFELVGFARTGALAPDEMRVFDVRSAGFIPGEGCGMVVLMRHADALAQGRRVYALVRGWGISSDGHGGISRPEASGQLLALERAYRRAGLDIGEAAYFEGHGTGTAVGDATELKALRLALTAADARPPVPTVAPAVGSIKANIGHTKAAAGAAGVIKAALAVHHQVLPPTTGCEEPHPELAGGALRVLRQAEAWPAARPLLAGISGMGFGGINSHVVVEGVAPRRRPALGFSERRLAGSAQDCELLLLAAPDEAALAARVEQLLGVAGRISRAELGDLAAVLAASLAADLPGGRVRAALVAARPAELAERLAALRGWLHRAGGAEARRLAPREGLFLGRGGRPGRIGLLFPGQGSPAHLGGGLWRRRFEALEDFYREAGLPGEGDGVDTAVAQPAIATHSLAGLRMLERLGVAGVAAVGHSLGEMTALHWAGALDEEALLRLARARGRAMAELGAATGAMGAIAAPAEEVAGLLAEGVVVAGYNSPRDTVVSGEAAAVERVLARARARGLVCTRLKVSHAFHSSLVAAAAPRLAEALAGEALRPPVRRVGSTVTGALLAEDSDLRALLARQVTSPVRFTAALAAVGESVDLWIEVGPGRVLTDLLAGSGAVPAVALDAGGESLRGLLDAAAAAFCLGVPIDPAALFAGRHARPFDLDRRPRFLVNPCELAPLPMSGEEAAAVAAPPRPASRYSPTARPARSGEDSAIPAANPDGTPAGLRVPAAVSPLAVVRQLVAARAELPEDLVRDESRLLGDLHLNSISVGQVVAEAARQLGAEPPPSPADYAQATVGELAQVIESLAAQGPSGAVPGDGPPAGVDAWVRLFATERVARALPVRRRDGPAGPWTVLAPPGLAPAAELGKALAAVPGRGVAVWVTAELDREAVERLLAGARALLGEAGPRHFVLIQEGPSGASFARTLHLERPDTTTSVVAVPAGDPRAAAWAAAEAGAARTGGYAEAWYGGDGARQVPVLRPVPSASAPVSRPGSAEGSAGLPVGPGDVVLATGGGKGIAAECALALARASGAAVVLLGRSRPEKDAELAANLERFAAAGVRWHYAAADVTDAAAVRGAVLAAAAALGPITGVLHGAGANTPRLLGELDAAAFDRTLAPKLGGAENVLAAVDPVRLRLFVAFGSIIARTGMRGEADYALANERLAAWTAALAERLPACRCRAIEWSVWSGTGMGERLGRLAALVQQGITPIPVDRGVELFLEALSRPLPDVRVVAAGRFGDPPTLEVERPELPLLRFLETPRVFYPGVELVVDAELRPETDPYLEDHVFRGDRLLPAVLGLEAMAQAAMAVSGRGERPAVFEKVELLRPVVVPRQGSCTIRVAALVRGQDEIELALRTADTGFGADHFRATCRFEAPALAGSPSLANLAQQGGPVPHRNVDAHPPRLPGGEDAMDTLRPDADLYGGVLFQTGRFQRVGGYRSLRATECLAEISPDGVTSWFGRYLPGDLVLGDPGVRDAAIHGIQACVPHATVLPTGVERIVTGRLSTAEPYLLEAREREHEGDSFVYDCRVLDAMGREVERWEGLALRAVERVAPPHEWALGLLGPYLERRLGELAPGAGMQVALERHGREAANPEGAPGRGRAADDVLRRLLGAGVALHHRPDGKPETVAGPAVSLSHAGDLLFAVASGAPGGGLSGVGDHPASAGCDLEPVEPREEQLWRDLLGAERYRLAELLASESGEDADGAATRVWAAGECLTKAGALAGAPLVLELSTPDGWQLLRSGGHRIGTLVAPVREVGRRMAFAVLLGA